MRDIFCEVFGWLLDLAVSAVDLVCRARQAIRVSAMTPADISAQNRRIVDNWKREFSRLEQVIRDAEIRQSVMPRPVDELRARLWEATSAPVVNMERVRGLRHQIDRLESPCPQPRTIEEARRQLQDDFAAALEAELNGFAPTIQVDLRAARQELSRLKGLIIDAEQRIA